MGYLPPCAKLCVPSDLSLDWKLVNWLSKIQTEAEFSTLMSERFVGFPPSGGTRNYGHGGKGPFRSSFWTLTKLVSLHQKSHQNLSLLNFMSTARISTPRGTPIHKRAGGGARREFRKRLLKNGKRYLSLRRVGVATIDVYP